MRPTYAEIDLGAIRHNVGAFRELIEPSKVCAVVKADGYGHGDVPVANAAVDAGAEWLAVALVEEGIRLREAGVQAPIILLSQPSPESIPDIIRWELTPTAYRDDFVEAMATAESSFDVHVKVDTGMHRVGVAPEGLGRVLAKINASANLNLAGLWTHFSVADEDPEYTRRQIELFDRTIEGLDPPMVHIANTAGASLFPESRRDMCRIGLGTYGLHPASETRQVVSLRPAMRLVSHVSHVQRVARGSDQAMGA